jgi:membrane associated rhomboid family serine protease
MFFPIGDVNLKRGSKPMLAYALIAINVAVFLYQFSLGPQAGQQFIFQYGSIPVEITHGRDLYTLITCTFLHGGWMHLIGNMLFLWVFADNIEATLGYGRFILFYLAGGIAASLAQSLLAPTSQVPCVGASGAIAACLGAYLVMYPHSKIKIFFLAFFTTFEVSAIYFLGFWILQQLMNGVGTLGARASFDGGVAYWAHIGGFAYGVLVGFLNRKKALELSSE